MEILSLILALALLGLWLSNRDLRRRVMALELQRGAPEEARQKQRAAAVPLQVEPNLPPAPEPEPAGERFSFGGLFEQWVAGRLLIWLGGAALVIAAIFLIRFSIEIGLVTPVLRMIAAGLFGLVLLAAGEYARAGRMLADDPRIGQALVGAGLAVLYATVYGSHALHQLIGAATASLLMLAVTAAALSLSLRHGAATAIMGLVGGFLTPLLVGDPQAGAIPLLAYLALLDSALFLIAWRRGWSWLAAAAVVLSFGWSGWLMAQPAPDAFAAGLFVVMLALAASTIRPGGGSTQATVQPLALGLIQLGWLAGRIDLGAAGWTLFGVLAAASLALAAFDRTQRPAPFVAAALTLALLWAKAVAGTDPYLGEAAIGATLIFGLGGGAFVLRQREALWLALASAGFAGPALILRALRPDLLDQQAWGAVLVALALGPMLLTWFGRKRATAEPPADLALLATSGAAAALAGSGAYDLVATDWAAAAWLGIAILLALAARRLDDLALATIAAVTAALAIARIAWTMPELSSAVISATVGEPVLAPDLPPLSEALLALALPAALLLGLWAAMPALLRARRALPALAVLLMAAAAYVAYKQAFGLASAEDFAARGLVERTIITQALFVLGWLLCSGLVNVRAVDQDLLRRIGNLLILAATARLIWLDLFVFNPAWREQWVGPWPVLNWILPAYLVSALWLYLARRRTPAATRSGLWLATFLASLIAGAMLLVRQTFQGAILTGPTMPTSEFYLYSLAGLILSIGLLLAGMRLPDKALRLAGLVLLTATMFKVFLVDASELTGVLRILSFLGLGVALIGIGRLYGPVLRAEAPK
ncbi:MAG: DUF2339 domain-containing protein [Sphingosinicella sp.]